MAAAKGEGVGVAQRILIASIAVYQHSLGYLLGGRCRFVPSCSHYAVDAIRVHGPLRGVGLATWRLLRCHPFCPGGHDPVPRAPGQLVGGER